MKNSGHCIYLDGAAAARPLRGAAAYRAAVLRDFPGNQEAGNFLGRALRRELDAASERLSEAVIGKPRWRVIWGVGATGLLAMIAESPLIAGRSGVSSRLEHPAVTANLLRCASGVKFLPADRRGRIIAPGAVEHCDFAVFHAVQSELGVRQDFGELFARFPGAFCLLDAVQSCGKLPPRDPERADAVVVSGHKFGAPGAAAVLVNPDSAAGEKLMEFAAEYRAGQHRSERPEPAELLTMCFCAQKLAGEMSANLAKFSRLNARLRRGLLDLTLPGGGRVVMSVPPEESSPYIVHTLFPGLESGVLVRMLSERGVAAAAGSACSAESKEPSAALKAIGLKGRMLWSGLRFSFDFALTRRDVDKTLEALRDVLQNY